MTESSSKLPSPDAIAVAAAHELYRRALGTEREKAAYLFLESVVRWVQARATP